jgi:hypothetical protein
MMTRSRVVLIGSVVLFLGWLCWLGYLVAKTTRPTVLSRPQFLVAEVYVIADLEGEETPADVATVKQVVWAAPGVDLPREKVPVKNLSGVKAEQGWHGPGGYILALSRTQDTKMFQLTPLPRTPGFMGGPGRIYPATHQTLEQLDRLKAELHPQAGLTRTASPAPPA